jgi:hypothetical protein
MRFKPAQTCTRTFKVYKADDDSFILGCDFMSLDSCFAMYRNEAVLSKSCNDENKQRLFHCTALTAFYNRDGVFTARYVLHSTFCPHSVFVSCVDLRINSDCFNIQY